MDQGDHYRIPVIGVNTFPILANTVPFTLNITVTTICKCTRRQEEI